MTKLEELRAQEAAAQKVYDEANAAKRAAVKKAKAFLAEAERDALAAIDAEHDPVSRAAWLVLHPLTTAAQAEAVREAEAGENLPHPLGTVFVKWNGAGWTRNASGTGGDYARYELSGERATLEVFRSGDTVAPGRTRASYSGPIEPGDLVLRDLLKSGKRGVTCRKFRAGDLLWLPEGVQHPVAQAKP